MPTVAVFRSRLKAQQAVDVLLANAIASRIVRTGDWTLEGDSFRVEISEPAELPRAHQLLAELDSDPSKPDPGWESQVELDLTRLPPGTTAHCPTCDQPLPLDSSISACPGCAAAVDIMDILVQKYGPDLLAGCYPDTDTHIPDAMIDSAILSCPGCGYSLAGLPRIGECPECGRGFSKAALLRGINE